ncbi:hypothetical protein AgCh_016203 [Apium graveolens]
MTISPSPLMGTLLDIQIPGRKRNVSGDVVEKIVERRQKRMIKNRESAARSRARKQELDTATAIAAQLKALTMKVDSLANYGVNQITSVCELCVGAHETEQCAISSESAQFVSNFQSWSNTVQLPYQQYPAKQYNPPGFQQPYYTPRQQLQLQQSNEKSELEELKLMCKSQTVSIKTLENQIGQISNALLNHQPGTLPSDTEVPGKREAKEQVKAITLRSGKVANPEHSQVSDEEAVAEEEVQKEAEVEPRKTIVEHTPPEGNTGEEQIYPPPPFPKRLQKKKLDKQFEKFWRCSRNFISTYLSLKLLNRFLVMRSS